MKSILNIAFATITAASGMAVVPQPAFALTSQNASVCKPYFNSNTANILTMTNGVFNGTGSSTNVICPVIRTIAAPSNGYSVYVDGTAAAGTAYCTLYSTNYNGAYMGSVSFYAIGTFSQTLTLPQAKVPYYSSQNVVCTLPPNGGIYDVQPVQ